MRELTVLGFDPGARNTGWAIVKREKTGAFLFLSGGLVDFPAAEEGVRYLYLENLIGELVNGFDIDGIAVERVFWGRNITSCLSTAEVIGVVSLAAARAGISAVRLTPQMIKSVSGSPKSTKKQLARVVSKLLSLPEGKKLSHHESDAAAVAISGILHGAGDRPPRAV